VTPGQPRHNRSNLLLNWLMLLPLLGAVVGIPLLFPAVDSDAAVNRELAGYHSGGRPRP